MITRTYEIDFYLLRDLYEKYTKLYYYGLAWLCEHGYASTSFDYCEEEVLDAVMSMHTCFFQHFVNARTGEIDLSIARFEYVLGLDGELEYLDVLKAWHLVLLSEHRLMYLKQLMDVVKRKRNLKIVYIYDGGVKYYGKLNLLEPFLLECCGVSGHYVSCADLLLKRLAHEMGVHYGYVTEFISSGAALPLVLNGSLVEHTTKYGKDLHKFLMLRKKEDPFYMDGVWDSIRDEYLGCLSESLILTDTGYYVLGDGSDVSENLIFDLSTEANKYKTFDVVEGKEIVSSTWQGCYMPVSAYGGYEGITVNIDGISYIPMRDIKSEIDYDYLGLQSYIDAMGV